MDLGAYGLDDSDVSKESDEESEEAPVARQRRSRGAPLASAAALPPPLPDAKQYFDAKQYLAKIATLEAERRTVSITRDASARQITALVDEVSNMHEDVVDVLFQYEESLGKAGGHNAAEKFGQSLAEWKERLRPLLSRKAGGQSVGAVPFSPTAAGSASGANAAALRQLQAKVAQLTAEKATLQRDGSAASGGEKSSEVVRLEKDKKKLAKDLSKAKTERARAKEHHQVWERRARETKDKYRERKGKWEKEAKDYEKKTSKLRAQRDDARRLLKEAGSNSNSSSSSSNATVASAVDPAEQEAAIKVAVAAALDAAADDERKRAAERAAAAGAASSSSTEAAVSAAVSAALAVAADEERKRGAVAAAAAESSMRAAVAAALVAEQQRAASASDPLRETVDTLQATLGAMTTRAEEAERNLAMRTASEGRLHEAVASMEAAAAASASGSSAEQQRLLSEHSAALELEQSKREAVLAEGERRVVELQAELVASSARAESSTADVQALQSELAAAQQSVARAKELEAELRAAGAVQRERVAELEASVAAEEAKRGTVHAELTSTKAALAARSARLATVSQGLARVSLELKALRAATTTLAQDVRAQNGAEAIALFTDAAAKIDRVTQQAFASLSEKFLAECKKRRALFNELQELKGNIRVICRCRPVSRTEAAEGYESVVHVAEGEGRVRVTRKGRKHAFDFDHCFGPESSNGDVYKEVSGLITSVLDGYNVCIFAYGQTGTGKTFTMMGPDGGAVACPDPSLAGLNQRALDDLFVTVAERSTGLGAWSIEVTVSVLEVYNEEVRDLLDPASPKGGKKIKLASKKKRAKMEVEGLIQESVANSAEVLALMGRANGARSTAATSMNEHSSRSHLVLQVNVLARNVTEGTFTSGKLNLIDLAGSERIAKSKVSGARQAEAIAINKSLSALAGCIEVRACRMHHVCIAELVVSLVLCVLVLTPLLASPFLLFETTTTPHTLHYSGTRSEL